MRGDLLSWFRGDRRDSNGKNRLIKDKDFSINDELIGDNLDPQAITVTLHT
jgi:hypothetical protein